MNAVEIEEAITMLAEQPYDAAEFPFAFRHSEIRRQRLIACVPATQIVQILRVVFCNAAIFTSR